MGIEPTTLALEARCSTSELLPQMPALRKRIPFFYSQLPSQADTKPSALRAR